ncbi:MAG: hypothetical protein OXD54_18790 [Candidatus Poribacteria bacterium]|nr:hypothetical protein [Candidatus Poribacteria bacterium]
MNHAKSLTDEAIVLLKDAIIHVLRNARESGHADETDADGNAYIKATNIGKEMGTYMRSTPPCHSLGRIHRLILDMLWDEGRVEPLCSESDRKIGWRLTDD